MPRPLDDSRFALILRRFRGRFGIAAPKVAVRTHIPWYLRVVSIAAVTVFCFVLVAWAYNAGRGTGAQTQSEVSDVVNGLRLANSSLENEIARLRSLLAASESSLQIEQASQKLLSDKNNTLAVENVRLKEELGVFERLARFEGKSDDDIAIENLNVRPDEKPGRYRFTFLIALKGVLRGKDTQFDLQFTIYPRAGTAGDKVIIPNSDNPDVSQYHIALRNFRRIEGKFDLPAGYIVGKIETNILEAGVLRATKNLVL